MKNTFRDEEGASLVEFAISASVLFSVLFGIFYMCMASFAYDYVTQTARNATRYAIVRGSSCIGFSDCKITDNQISNYVQSHGLGGMTAQVTRYHANNSSGSTIWTVCTGCNAPGDAVAVNVNYALPMNIPFVPLGTFHMNSTSQMVISQ